MQRTMLAPSNYSLWDNYVTQNGKHTVFVQTKNDSMLSHASVHHNDNTAIVPLATVAAEVTLLPNQNYCPVLATLFPSSSSSSSVIPKHKFTSRSVFYLMTSVPDINDL